jgi:hypothetical protein
MTNTEHPRLDWHLENWAQWHIHGETSALNVKTQRHWASGSADFDQLADTQEKICAIAMEVLIHGDSYHRGVLTIVEECIIHHYHLGTAVWRANREPNEAVYERARQKLSDGLKRKGIS